MAHTYDSLNVGDTFETVMTVSAADVRAYADLTGDDNPIHVDPEYAATTDFGQPIAHGALLLGYISKVLGRDYPGHGSVAVSLSAKFLRPVPVDSEVTIEVKITEKIERFGHVKAKVYVYRGGKMACGGEAVVIPPKE
ncbi:MAG: MaoC family dehydratase [Bacteroidota bacterium]